MEDQQLYLHRLHREGQDRLTYFVLAAAGACMAFALTQSNDAALDWKHLPLGLALASWAGSFLFGTEKLRFVDAYLYNNAEYLRVLNGEHPRLAPRPDVLLVLRQGLERASERAQRRAVWSYRLLIAGAAFYVSWQCLEMYLRR